MSQYRSVFLICDPRGVATPAVEHAAALAQASGAGVHLCLFDHSQAILRMGLIDHDRMTLAREHFLGQKRVAAQALARGLSARGIRATADVAWSRPAHVEMLRQIGELKPDVVIKDARDEPLLLKRMLFTPTDWQLLRHCPVPLLLVRPQGAALPKRVVVAVDPGPYARGTVDVNDRIIRAALGLAIQSDAEVQMVFALDAMAELAPVLSGSPAGFSDEACQALLEVRADAFEALAKAHGVPADRRHQLQGPVGPAIADFATRWNADLVVLGTAQRSGVERWVLGSSAEQILDYVPCSVLAVPPPAD